MKVKNMVPEIYYRESRDFSYIGRIFEILFNFIKTNVDIMSGSPINNEVSSSIIDLLVTSLGFESRHKYQNEDLVALCSSFALLLRNKGNAIAIEEAITILLHTQRIDESFDIGIDDDDDHKFIIYIPSKLDDIILLEDIFDYILPSGYTYAFRTQSGASDKYSDNYTTNENIEVYTDMKGYNLGQVGGRTDENESNTIETSYGEDANRSMTYTSTITGGEKADNTGE